MKKTSLPLILAILAIFGAYLFINQQTKSIAANDQVSPEKPEIKLLSIKNNKAKSDCNCDCNSCNCNQKNNYGNCSEVKGPVKRFFSNRRPIRRLLGRVFGRFGRR